MRHINLLSHRIEVGKGTDEKSFSSGYTVYLYSIAGGDEERYGDFSYNVAHRAWSFMTRGEDKMGKGELAAAHSIFPQWAQDLNAVLTFLGFLLTVYVTVQVWSIKRQYTARGRLPGIIEDLSASGSELNTRLAAWPQRRQEFMGEVKVATELLATAAKLLGRSDKSTITEIQAKLASAGSVATIDDAQGWDMYYDVQRAIVKLKQVSKDLNWK
jgi:hypothetical protein